MSAAGRARRPSPPSGACSCLVIGLIQRASVPGEDQTADQLRAFHDHAGALIGFRGAHGARLPSLRDPPSVSVSSGPGPESAGTARTRRLLRHRPGPDRGAEHRQRPGDLERGLGLRGALRRGAGTTAIAIFAARSRAIPARSRRSRSTPTPTRWRSSRPTALSTRTEYEPDDEDQLLNEVDAAEHRQRGRRRWGASGRVRGASLGRLGRGHRGKEPAVPGLARDDRRDGLHAPAGASCRAPDALFRHARDGAGRVPGPPPSSVGADRFVVWLSGPAHPRQGCPGGARPLGMPARRSPGRSPERSSSSETGQSGEAIEGEATELPAGAEPPPGGQPGSQKRKRKRRR